MEGICVNFLDQVQFLAWDVIYTSRSARCNIYISHLCYDASVCLSVRLSVMFVHYGHRVRWIPDIFACLDRWMSLLLTDNASPGSSNGMMPGFLLEERGMEKLMIVVISLILLIFYRWTGITWRYWVLTTQNIVVDNLTFFLVISVENALCLKTVWLITTSDHIGLKRRHIVRILCNGRRIKRGIKCVTEKWVTYTQPCSVWYKMHNRVTA